MKAKTKMVPKPRPMYSLTKYKRGANAFFPGRMDAVVEDKIDKCVAINKLHRYKRY